MPAGSFIVTANVGIWTQGTLPNEYASASCTLADSEGGSTAGLWTGATAWHSDEPVGGRRDNALAGSHLSRSEHINRANARQNVHDTGVTLEAENGSLVAVQTSGNS